MMKEKLIEVTWSNQMKLSFQVHRLLSVVQSATFQKILRVLPFSFDEFSDNREKLISG